MPGGGLRSTNINHIQEVTQAIFYHSSAITDGSQIANPEEIFKLKSNLK
jgi:copper homeostasis protein